MRFNIVYISCFFGVVGIVGILGFYSVTSYIARANAPIPVKLDPNIGVRTYVTEFFTDNNAQAMLPIIKCESEFKHYNDDGTTLANREGSSAVGVAQILASQHPDPKIIYRYNKRFDTGLTVEDFDVTTLEGNIGYALILYEIRGTRDWECSKKV